MSRNRPRSHGQSTSVTMSRQELLSSAAVRNSMFCSLDAAIRTSPIVSKNVPPPRGSRAKQESRAAEEEQLMPATDVRYQHELLREGISGVVRVS